MKARKHEGQRYECPLSFSPKNADACFVMAQLQQVPPRQRSATMWAWAAAYLRGESQQIEIQQEDEIDTDDFASLIEGL